jgi:hypothetical protein
MVTRITKLDYDYTRFATSDGSPTFFKVKVELEEGRTNRLYAEDIRQFGLVRSGA